MSDKSHIIKNEGIQGGIQHSILPGGCIRPGPNDFPFPGPGNDFPIPANRPTKHKCLYCKGTGAIKNGILSAPCGHCHGMGFTFSDPKNNLPPMIPM